MVHRFNFFEIRTDGGNFIGVMCPYGWFVDFRFLKIHPGRWEISGITISIKFLVQTNYFHVPKQRRVTLLGNRNDITTNN